MRKFLFISTLIAATFISKAQELSYYLPDSISYNPAIPKPKDVIYHEVGEWHVTHDRLVNYMRAIATAAPDRVKMEIIGYTYERRPQVMLIISAKKNLDNLEAIRQQHLQLSDASKSSSLDIEKMPAVVWIGHSIHGNESSGSNAALLSAYYLAAAQGRQIEELLDQVVILFDPSFNPDGLQRFSTWANQHKSRNLVSDPNSREFNEVWPGGRFNHYWFDLNRDWLPAVHVESQNRLAVYHSWKPNILTDHHEQGSNATFFFQPGVPSRVNPLTPAKNQELTMKLGKFHAQYLDRIGSMYFTGENYDDFYYGKGSTYPDINGGIGILFEQASSRGHLQQTANGLLSFPFTIRNQFITALSTLEGAKALRRELLEYQRDFFKKAVTPGNNPVKAYVFGDKNDQAKTFHFLQMLQRNNISVNELGDGWKHDEFEKGKAYIVSMNQAQHQLIRTIFEPMFEYKDSLFYDITSWSMPYAFMMPFTGLTTVVNENMGSVVTNSALPKGDVFGGKSEYAYLFEWDEYYAPALLYRLQEAGILAKVATNKFEMLVNGKPLKFDYGTIEVPVKIQTITSDRLYEQIKQLAEKHAVKVYSMQGGNVISGSDLGSSKFAAVTKPVIAMITGQGVNATDAGEVWHLLDQRMNIPTTHLEPVVFNRIDLSKYNALIMVGGTYNELNKEKLKSWVQGGGTLILTEEAINWAVQNGISEVKFKKAKSPVDSTQKRGYTEREQIDGAQQMNGAIFGAEIDLTHPLAYGYNQKTLSLFKANKVFMEKSKNPYATPFHYGSKPLQSGWVSRENADAIRNSAAVVVNTVGNGRVINIADNPNFRAFWLGGSKLFMNAIFFGKNIDAASARAED